MREQPNPVRGASPFVLPLRQIGRGDLATAGGKGANLGELVRAGLPVPPGFVLTTAAYDRFVADNGLQEIIGSTLRAGPDGAAIRGAFEGATVPPEVGRPLRTAYDGLGQGPVAVRSSATAEDLPGAAFAGQHDTFLNVVGPEALEDAVRRCWASLWTDRAIAYRERGGIDQGTVKLAVVVQCMAAAEAAGVLFTANPVTGARDETVIDANPGLGEAVVSGRATPDHYRLRKRWWRWQIAERRPGRREVVIRSRAGGGTELVSPEAAAAAAGPALPDQALRRLARLGAAVQRHFGGPQDVEWAWGGGRLVLVQARPITALPEPISPTNRLKRMLAHMAAELFPTRPYPLDLTAWGPAIFGAVAPMFSPLGLAALPLDRIFVVEDGVAVRLRGRLPLRPTAGVLLAPLRLLLLAGHYNPVRWQADPLLVEARARVRALETRNLGALSWDGVLAVMRRAMTIPWLSAGEVRRRYFPRAALAAGLLRLLLGLLRRGNLFGALLSGAETKTLETNRALEDLATRIRSDPAVAETFAIHDAGDISAALEGRPSGRAFLAAFRAFLDRYGHREAVITTALRPTWKDAPEAALGILKGLAAAPPSPPAGRPAWEAARDELLAHAFLRLPPLRSAFLALLAPARRLLQIREDTHFYATQALPVMRRAALELGRRLVGAGVLDAPEDVFHLQWGELERVDGIWPPPSADRLRATAARRKAWRAALEGSPLLDPRLLRQSPPEGDVLLRGTPGGPGVAEGPVRVVRDGSEFGRLRTGDVLVAPYTNPSWTPLFRRAAAVVVDSGGAASHAAIVAREYGIPAVMGTIDGTGRLADGRRVRVDGGRGLVLAAEAAPVPLRR